MTKEELKEQLLTGKNAAVTLPGAYWALILRQLDCLCEYAMEARAEMDDDEFLSHTHEDDFQGKFAAPFLTRALIIEELVEKGMLPKGNFADRDMAWAVQVLSGDVEELVN